MKPQMTLYAMSGMLVSTMVQAQDAPKSLKAMFNVTGECSLLVYAGEERACRNLVINTEYDFGRIGFYFLVARDGAGIVAFSGMAQEQISPSASLRLQPIDTLIVDGVRKDAVGFCTFENPFAGIKARIECSAFLESGDLFSGFFMSDGSNPEMMPPTNASNLDAGEQK